LRGILFGTAIGLSPVLTGSLFGASILYGAGYLTIVTLPLGIITGSIIGATSKKIYSIQGSPTLFYDFKKGTTKYLKK